MMTPITRNLLLWFVTVSLGLSLASPASSRADKLPNIILCMGDDHGWEETGYNGHPHLKTPVLDEMAAMGQYAKESGAVATAYGAQLVAKFNVTEKIYGDLPATIVGFAKFSSADS